MSTHLFQKGNHFAQLGGRAKGSKNSKKFDVRKILDDLKFCPFTESVKLYRQKDTSNTIKQELLAELQAYAAPKLKAVELSGNDGEQIQLLINTKIDEMAENTAENAEQKE